MSMFWTAFDPIAVHAAGGGGGGGGGGQVADIIAETIRFLACQMCPCMDP